MRFQSVALLALVASATARASLFGEETVVLGQMLANQIRELDVLAENVGISKDQRNLLLQLNSGINQATQQIETVQNILERIQGTDPTSIRSIADINRAMEDMKYVSGQIQELLIIKLLLCDEAVEEASLQSDTSYKMGQEMAELGAKLSEESKTASPGRAQQISASAASSQMIAVGVELQTLSHISQLLAASLDLQKSQMERELKTNALRQAYFKQTLSGDRTALQKMLKSKPRQRKNRKHS
jgi:hypothetical protein